jgi:hypothetical protein
MNTAGIRHTAAALATATVVAAALTILPISTPSSASAHRPDPIAGPTTQCAGSAGNAGNVDSVSTTDSAVDIAHRKADMAQQYVDALHQRPAR